MRKPTTLIAGKFGSRHFGTKPYLADAVRLTGQDKPVAMYIGVASGDDRNFGSALSSLLKGAGVRKVVWPKLSNGKKKDALQQSTRAKQLLPKNGASWMRADDIHHEAERLEN